MTARKLGQEESAAPESLFMFAQILAVFLIGLGIGGLVGGLVGTWLTRRNPPPVVVVNEWLAQLLFPEGSAIGKRIAASGDGAVEIVGVVVGLGQ